MGYLDAIWRLFACGVGGGGSDFTLVPEILVRFVFFWIVMQCIRSSQKTDLVLNGLPRCNMMGLCGGSDLALVPEILVRFDTFWLLRHQAIIHQSFDLVLNGLIWTPHLDPFPLLQRPHPPALAGLTKWFLQTKVCANYWDGQTFCAKWVSTTCH